MRITKLTITPITSEFKHNIVEDFNPEIKRATILMKDRLVSGDEIYAGNGLPNFMRGLIPQNKFSQYNIHCENKIENHKNPIWDFLGEMSKKLGPFLNK